MDRYPETLAAALVAALGSLTNVVRDEAANIPGKDGRQGYSYRYADLGGLPRHKARRRFALIGELMDQNRRLVAELLAYRSEDAA